jgi:hypothetical protein
MEMQNTARCTEIILTLLFLLFSNILSLLALAALFCFNHNFVYYLFISPSFKKLLDYPTICTYVLICFIETSEMPIQY